MLEFKTLNLSITNVVFRFYAMMAIVIMCGFMGQLILGALLAFVLAMSTILGVSFSWKAEKKAVTYKKVNQTLEMKKPAVGSLKAA